MQSQLTTYLKIPGNENLRDYINLLVKQKNALPTFTSNTFQLAEKYKKKIENALAKEKIEENKDFFNFD